MADMKLRISFDLGSVLDISKTITAQTAPLLNQAVRAVAQAVANNWEGEVHQAKLWQGERDAYASSIDWEMTGDFTAVVRADYKHAREIEEGRPARDLKKMLGTSDKVRRTEKGKRFLVIPLRHNVKKLQAAGLAGVAEALEASMVTGETTRLSGEVTHLSPQTGMSKSPHQKPFLSDRRTKAEARVAQNIYNWGSKLSSKQAGRNKWAQGLHRFDTSTPGSSKSSEYLTFRIMMEGQSGWVVPAQPGQYIAKKVVDAIQPKAEQAFAAAVKKDFGL